MTCFVFFTDIKNANKAATKARQSLEIRSSDLKSWGHHWEIATIDTTNPSEKLKNYVHDNVHKGNAVHSSLASIAETLSDSEKLLKRYGIKLEQLRDGANVSTLEWGFILEVVELNSLGSIVGRKEAWESSRAYAF